MQVLKLIHVSKSGPCHLLRHKHALFRPKGIISTVLSFIGQNGTCDFQLQSWELLITASSVTKNLGYWLQSEVRGIDYRYATYQLWCWM